MDASLSLEVEEGLREARAGYDVLHFNHQCLSELPTEIFQDACYQHISKIHAKGNRLKTLPERIEAFSRLTELYLHSNYLESLPKNIGSLSQLRFLDLSNNDLTDLPGTICDLTSLEVLTIPHNRIKHLPRHIGRMKNLQVIDLINNQIRDLPVEITQCRKLQRLLVDRNKLRWLPRQLCKMKHLEEVSATSNNLLCLPLDLGHVCSMKTVYVDNNKTLHAMPVSVQFQEIGFNSCGIMNEDDENDSEPSLSVTIQHDDVTSKVVYLPPEITMLGSTENCVLPLVELATRQLHRYADAIDLCDLPLNLHDILHGPTSLCVACQRPVFTAGFPMVFEGQIRVYSLYYVGLCCSIRCVKIASLCVQLPVVYPDSAVMSMALALVN